MVYHCPPDRKPLADAPIDFTLQVEFVPVHDLNKFKLPPTFQLHLTTYKNIMFRSIKMIVVAIILTA